MHNKNQTFRSGRETDVEEMEKISDVFMKGRGKCISLFRAKEGNDVEVE